MSLKFKKKFLAIITARKGSKGVKNKNLKKIYDDYFENLKVIKNKYLLQ